MYPSIFGVSWKKSKIKCTSKTCPGYTSKLLRKSDKLHRWSLVNHHVSDILYERGPLLENISRKSEADGSVIYSIISLSRLVQ